MMANVAHFQEYFKTWNRLSPRVRLLASDADLTASSLWDLRHGNDIVSLCSEIYPGASSQLAVLSPAVLCICVPSPLVRLKRCRSFVSATHLVALVEALRGSPWSSEPIGYFSSCLCTVIWFCTTYHMNPSYSLPPQHGWEDVCAPPASAEFHAHGKPTLRLFVEVKEWCTNDCPNKYQRHVLSSCIVIIRVCVYIDLIICQAHISCNRKRRPGTVK